jgi:hypothetical protein
VFFFSLFFLVQSIDTSSAAAAVWVPGGGLNLLCASLSPNSRFVACSDPIQVKLYELRQTSARNPNAIAVRKIKHINTLVQPASVMAFSAVSFSLSLRTLFLSFSSFLPSFIVFLSCI